MFRQTRQDSPGGLEESIESGVVIARQYVQSKIYAPRRPSMQLLPSNHSSPLDASCCTSLRSRFILRLTRSYPSAGHSCSLVSVLSISTSADPVDQPGDWGTYPGTRNSLQLLDRNATATYHPQISRSYISYSPALPGPVFLLSLLSLLILNAFLPPSPLPIPLSLCPLAYLPPDRPSPRALIIPQLVSPSLLPPPTHHQQLKKRHTHTKHPHRPNNTLVLLRRHSRIGRLHVGGRGVFFGC